MSAPAESCCELPAPPTTPTRCPECGRPGRAVERLTLKALLRPAALERLSRADHRFCATERCPVVYFAADARFTGADLAVPVFQKQPAGDRTICYCLGIGEADLRREVLVSDGSSPVARVDALVKAGRCACEVRNPQGTCCLGNLRAAVTALRAEAEERETRGPRT